MQPPSDDEADADMEAFLASVCRTEVSYLDLFLLSAFLAVRTLNCQRKTPANEAHLVLALALRARVKHRDE